MIKELPSLQVKVKADTSELEAALDRCNEKLQRVRLSIDEVIQEFQRLGKIPIGD